jgi:tyrosyl-tRNA synthetase
MGTTDLARIKKNTVEIIPENELAERLASGRPLRVKLGIDPTAPDIHLGLAVVLRKLREFQDMGHTAVLIVGDFTAKIGDPSGRSRTRPQLSDSDIEKNMETYRPQIFKILHEEQTEFRYNSEWLGSLSSKDIIELAAKFTVAQVLERDDIAKRYEKNEPIALHELLYGLFQAYDSVAVNADIELGGSDQRFNVLFGREMQRQFDQTPQVVVLMPLLEGTDGVKKMSKSYGNYVGITESPEQIFGKLMSITDACIGQYARLTTDLDEKEIERDLNDKTKNPRDIKLRLAREVVAIYHSQEEAVRAEEEFLQVFSKRELPSEIPCYTPQEKKIWIVKLLVDSGLVPTRNEARRLIDQGGVKLDGVPVKDANFEFEPKSETTLQVGKRRFLKICVKK